MNNRYKMLIQRVLLGLLFAGSLLSVSLLNAMFNLNELKSRLGKLPSAGKGASQVQAIGVNPLAIQQFNAALKGLNVDKIKEIVTAHPGLVTSEKAEVLKQTTAKKTSNEASCDKLFDIFNFLLEKSDDVNLYNPSGDKRTALDAAIANVKEAQVEYNYARNQKMPAQDEMVVLEFYKGLAQTLIAKGGFLKEMANDSEAQRLVVEFGGVAQVLAEEPVSSVEVLASAGKKESKFATRLRPLFTGRKKPSRKPKSQLPQSQQKASAQQVVSMVDLPQSQQEEPVQQVVSMIDSWLERPAEMRIAIVQRGPEHDIKEVDRYLKLNITDEQKKSLSWIKGQLFLLDKAHNLGRAIKEFNLPQIKEILGATPMLLNAGYFQYGRTPLMMAIGSKCSVEDMGKQRAVIDYLSSLEGINLNESEVSLPRDNALALTLRLIKNVKNDDVLQNHYKMIASKLIAQGATYNFGPGQNPFGSMSEVQGLINELRTSGQEQVVPAQVIHQASEVTPASPEVVSLQNVPQPSPQENLAARRVFSPLDPILGAIHNGITAALKDIPQEMQASVINKFKWLDATARKMFAADKRKPKGIVVINDAFGSPMFEIARNEIDQSIRKIVLLGIMDYFGYKQPRVSSGYLFVDNQHTFLKGMRHTAADGGTLRLEQWLECEDEAEAEEILKKLTDDYKIHLMPKGMMISEAIALFKAIKQDQKLKDVINDIKFDVAECDDESIKDEEFPFPKMVIYPASGKAQAQFVLNKLLEIFDRREGLNATPRFNAKVTSLIYYAQGNGDEKKVDDYAKFFDEPKKIFYNSTITGNTEKYHLQIKKIMPQRKPQAASPASAVSSQEIAIAVPQEAAQSITKNLASKVKRIGSNFINAQINNQLERCVQDIIVEENKLSEFKSKQESLSKQYQETLKNLEAVKRKKDEVKREIDRLTTKLNAIV